jgi:hypothetical protein
VGRRARLAGGVKNSTNVAYIPVDLKKEATEDASSCSVFLK